MTLGNLLLDIRNNKRKIIMIMIKMNNFPVLDYQRTDQH